MFQIAVLWDEGFPAVDVAPQTLAGLRSALEGFPVHILSADSLERLPHFDLLVMPFGSAFPKPTWPQIAVYLENGGNLLNLGGAPFTVPCGQEHVAWKPEERQTAYHEALHINQALPVFGDRIAALEVPKSHPILAGIREPLQATRVFELITRLTGAHDKPEEPGASGPRDATIYPLLTARDASGMAVAAPVVAVDWQRGPFAGGRWVLANVDGTIDQETIRRLAFYAAQGASDFTVSPSFACYFGSERPRLSVHLGQFGRVRGRYTASLAVTDPGGIRRTCDLEPIDAGEMPAYRWSFCNEELFGEGDLTPGFYTVEATLISRDARAMGSELRIPEVARPGTRVHHNGFWVWDAELMRGGSQWTLDADYFRRDGAVYPVIGASYSGSDAPHRFLMEPNPYVWDGDFRQMKEAGINLVRAGVRAAWRRIMDEPGTPDEEALRALDAFLLTARRYDLPVIFSFFSTLPEAWGGENPYLDPRAVAAQRNFISAFTERYLDTPGVMWDLINAPSFCSPEHPGETRPQGDRFERDAWSAWLSRRGDGEPRERWNMTPRQPATLPAPRDFLHPAIFQGDYPMRALDYRLFAQDAFNYWINDLTSYIRVRNTAEQPITVGQDERGVGELPNPHFHADFVDFTSTQSAGHEDTLWNCLLTNTLRKPHLLAQVSVPFLENLDGIARFTEDDRRNLLERKMALAFSCACAGAVQWQWNTDPYLRRDDEVAAGLMRADGSARPELAVVSGLADFFRRNSHRMEDREVEPAVLVIPHSEMLSPRNLATAATQACVRAFHSGAYPAIRAVSEYFLQDLGSPRLIVLPSPRVLRDEAWDALLAQVNAGATLLLTGPIGRDPYWRPRQRLGALGLTVRSHPVAREEFTTVGGQRLHLTFGGDKPQRVDKAVIMGGAQEVVVLPHGSGKVVFSPLPFELADNGDALSALYDLATAESGLQPSFLREQPDLAVIVRPLTFRDSVLYTLVSETNEDRTVTLLHGSQRVRLEVMVPAQRAVLLWVDRESGTELDRYAPSA